MGGYQDVSTLARSFIAAARAAARPIGAALACAAAASASAQPGGTLLAANRDGGSVSFFDLTSGVEIARVAVGPVIPHEVAVSADGRRALTSEYGTDRQPGRHLLVIDVPAARIVGRIDLGAPSRPHSMRFLPDGRAVVTMEDADELALVDVEAHRVVATYPTGGREGHMVRVSPDGSRAYVTSRGGAGTLSVVFLDRERPPVVIPTGAGAEGIAVTADGGEVWVANRAEATISIVDTERLEVIDRIPSRPYAGRIEISAQGRVLVPNGTGGEATHQFLSVYDAESRRLLETLPLGREAPERGAFGVLIVEQAAFVSDRARRRILIYDLDAPGEPRVLATDHEQADGLAWSPLRVDVYR